MQSSSRSVEGLKVRKAFLAKTYASSKAIVAENCAM